MIFHTNVFHESDDDSIKCILKHFKKIELFDNHDVTFKPISTYQGAFRGSIMLGLRLKRMESFTDTLNWAPIFRWDMVTPYFNFNDLSYIIESNIEWPKFVRPVKGIKTFSGNVFSKQKLKQEYGFLVQKNVDNPMCMFSDPCEILKEYRCVFINKQYVSGSQYMENGELKVDSNIPIDVIEYAFNLYKKFKYSYFAITPNFVMDVGIRETGRKCLVELNQIETSSFYGADLDKIYHTLSNDK